MDYYDDFPYNPYSCRGLCDNGYDDYSQPYYYQQPMVSREQPYPPYPRPPYPPGPDHPCPPKPYPPKPHPPKPVCPDVRDDYYTYPQNLVGALESIAMIVAGECHDEFFLNAMIKMAPTKYDKDAIAGMLSDMEKHMGLLRHIYCQLAGERLPKCKDGKYEKPKTYCDGIEKAFMKEIAKVEKYRKILFAMSDKRHMNMMTELVTDALIHVDKWDHLYARNEFKR
ncbi:MAG TPA: hypothetical protein VFD33_06105 [Bacillota bacterium]|nr:hypothetical protein [Bacillota bacterium]